MSKRNKAKSPSVREMRRHNKELEENCKLTQQPTYVFKPYYLELSPETEQEIQEAAGYNEALQQGGVAVWAMLIG